MTKLRKLHVPSLIRVFAQWVANDPSYNSSCEQGRLKSDWADV